MIDIFLYHTPILKLNHSIMYYVPLPSPVIIPPRFTLTTIVKIYVNLGYFPPELLDSNTLHMAGCTVAERMWAMGAQPPVKSALPLDGPHPTFNRYNIADLPKLFEIVPDVLEKLIARQKRDAEVAILTEMEREKEWDAFFSKNPNAYTCDCSPGCHHSKYIESDDHSENNPYTDHSENNPYTDVQTDHTDDRGCFRRDQIVAEKARRRLLLKRHTGAPSIVPKTSSSGRKRKAMRTSRRQKMYSGAM